MELTATYLSFTKRERKPKHTTDVFDVISKLSGEHEAVIKWHGRRGYSLFADDGKPFGPVCLGDLTRVCQTLNDDHKARKRLDVS